MSGQEGVGAASYGDGRALRLVVVAPRPFALGDLDIGDAVNVEAVDLVRRPSQLAAAFADVSPHLVVVAAWLFDDGGAAAVEAARLIEPDVAVLALTSEPLRLGDVAPATRAGADGFVDVDADPAVLAEAVGAVAGGGTWFSDDDVRVLLDQAGGELEVTGADRRARLTGILVGVIPLTGLLAAFMAYLWRKYTGRIGVRPVDIAVDPASRIVDAIVGLSLLLAVVGPLLFIGTWLDLLRASPFNRGVGAWLLRRRVLAWLAFAVAWLVLAYLATRGPDPILVMLVGPTVAVAIVARATALDDQLPHLLRIKATPMQVLVGGVTAVVLFVGSLGAEALFIGPELGTRGEGGIVVPRVIGFNAQPIRAFELDTDNPPRDLLYLGGNADLYVLVDPCNDNEVEYVSVGRHRLVVIDEITCADENG